MVLESLGQERYLQGRWIGRAAGQYSCCWAAPFTEGCTGFSPCLRTCQQSLLSEFCHSALYLQCLGLSQAVTAQQERHIPPPGKVHKTLRHSVVTSLLSPSKMSHQKLSQTSCSREPHLPAELHCCCNELQLSWSTYNKDSTKTQVPGNSCYSWSWRENKTRAGEVEILLFTSMTWTLLISLEFDKAHLISPSTD